MFGFKILCQYIGMSILQHYFHEFFVLSIQYISNNYSWVTLAEPEYSSVVSSLFQFFFIFNLIQVACQSEALQKSNAFLKNQF